MTAEQYSKARQAIDRQHSEAMAVLNSQVLAERLYPDGFIVQLIRRQKGEWITVSGPIRAAEAEANSAEVIYSLEITQPANYANMTQHPFIPAGKWETVPERWLLEGTGDDGCVPQQLPPQLTKSKYN